MVTDYYKGSKLLLLNLAIGLGTFIQVLDTSIANVAVPYIAGNLSVSADNGTWVITSFAVSNAIVLPLTGWLSAYFGQVRLFVWSVLLFSFVSFLCGLSTTLGMLILFRVAQGAVAGSLIPLSQTLLMASNPPEKQGGALGFWGTVVVVAPVLGPIVGGYLTDVYSWPWIFYINVPIGIFSALVVWFFLRDRESAIVKNPIDWVGLFLLSVAVACLQIMLDKGKDLDWFESNWIIGLTLVSIIAFGYFVIWNHYQKHPIVDFSFFKNRNFFFGTLAITMGYLTYFGATVIIPLWLQTEQNYTPFWAGLAVAPIGIISIFFANILGQNLHRFDLRMLAAVSFLFFSIGFFIQANFTTQISVETIMWTRFFQGFGVLFFFLPLVQLSLGDIPKKQYASAAGLFNFIRILIGSGFGTSLSVQIWSHLEIYHHARLTETVTTYDATTSQLYQSLQNHSEQFTPGIIDRVLDQQIEQQAYMLSTNDLSWLGAWLLLLMIPLIFCCKRVNHLETAVAGGQH
jgi:DHA2 family multidrug resistance protein